MEGEDGVEADHGHGEAGGGHQREAPHLLARHPGHLGRPRILGHDLGLPRRQEAVGEEVLAVSAELLRHGGRAMGQSVVTSWVLCQCITELLCTLGCGFTIVYRWCSG